MEMDWIYFLRIPYPGAGAILFDIGSSSLVGARCSIENFIPLFFRQARHNMIRFKKSIFSSSQKGGSASVAHVAPCSRD